MLLDFVIVKIWMMSLIFMLKTGRVGGRGWRKIIKKKTLFGLYLTKGSTNFVVARYSAGSVMLWLDRWQGAQCFGNAIKNIYK